MSRLIITERRSRVSGTDRGIELGLGLTVLIEQRRTEIECVIRIGRNDLIVVDPVLFAVEAAHGAILIDDAEIGMLARFGLQQLSVPNDQTLVDRVRCEIVRIDRNAGVQVTRKLIEHLCIGLIGHAFRRQLFDLAHIDVGDLIFELAVLIMTELDRGFLPAHDVDQRPDRAVLQRFADVRLLDDRLAVGKLLFIFVSQKPRNGCRRRLRRRFGRFRRFTALRGRFRHGRRCRGRLRRLRRLRRHRRDRRDLILLDLANVQPVKGVGVDRHGKRAGKQHVGDQNCRKTFFRRAALFERAEPKQHQIQNAREKRQRRNDQVQMLREKEGRIDHKVQSRIEMIEDIIHDAVGGEDRRQVCKDGRNDAQSSVLLGRLFLHAYLR